MLEKPEGKKPLVRPGRRDVVNIKMNLKRGWGGMD
jgi:hypothetical protein